MPKYVVYDATGKILRWGVCADFDVENSTDIPGEKVMVVDTLRNKFDLEHKVIKEEGKPPVIEPIKIKPEPEPL